MISIRREDEDMSSRIWNRYCEVCTGKNCDPRGNCSFLYNRRGVAPTGFVCDRCGHDKCAACIVGDRCDGDQVAVEENDNE
jgi:hypothetical protein